jgi:two-component system nitrate/nitrite sensor histidine kinase NarX
MRERAERIGAAVEVASVPGSGTCVVLTLPQREALAA